MRLAGVATRFHAVVSGDEVAHGKPAPDIYLEAARRLGMAPSSCVAFEDSEAGIRAVAQAGMRGVLVPHSAPTTEAIQSASWVVESLHQGREILERLVR